MINKMPNAPCKDCPDRTPTCHSTCKTYITYQEEMSAFTKERKENARVDRALNEMTSHRIKSRRREDKNYGR